MRLERVPQSGRSGRSGNAIWSRWLGCLGLPGAWSGSRTVVSEALSVPDVPDKSPDIAESGSN
jgi:hypothetical protein